MTYPGDPGGDLFKRHREPCVVASPAVLDSEWIPEVTRHGKALLGEPGPFIYSATRTTFKPVDLT